MNLGIVGASGVVGSEFLKLLDRKHLNINYNILRLYASKKSCGKEICIRNRNHKLRVFEEDQFILLDVLVLCCSAELSYSYVSMALSYDCIIIDNSSFFRLYPDVPLVIPEINANTISSRTKLIASPNCCTTILCMALHPLRKLGNIVKVNVSTYQAASGAGKEGLNELQSQFEEIVEGRSLTTNYFNRQYAMNLFSHNSEIDPNNGYNGEEIKMINETKKILGKVSINPTCIRVPIMRSHCETLNIQFDREINLDEVRKILENSNGIVVCDDRENNEFPEPIKSQNKLDVYVGRIRYDLSDSTKKTINLFISGDQLLKGAALNSYQILDLIGQKFYKFKNPLINNNII